MKGNRFLQLGQDDSWDSGSIWEPPREEYVSYTPQEDWTQMEQAAQEAYIQEQIEAQQIAEGAPVTQMETGDWTSWSPEEQDAYIAQAIADQQNQVQSQPSVIGQVSSTFWDSLKNLVSGAVVSGEQSLIALAQKAKETTSSPALLWNAAQAAGVSMPLDSDIQTLQAEAKNLSTLYYQAQSIVNKEMPPIKTLALPDISTKVDSVVKMLQDAMTLADTTKTILNSAASAGQSVQNQYKSSTIDVQATTKFYSQKADADAAYDLALAKIKSAISQATALKNSAVAAQQLKVSDVTGAVKGIGTTLAAGLSSIGQGLINAAPYLIPVAIALGAGYAIIYLKPRPRGR